MSYGIEFKDAAGNIVYGETQTGTREIQIEACAGNFSGTRSVPGFDDTKGALNVVVEAYPNPANGRPYVNLSSHPTLNWNNTTKVLTVTAVAAPWWAGLLIPDYRVGFFHNA